MTRPRTLPPSAATLVLASVALAASACRSSGAMTAERAPAVPGDDAPAATVDPWTPGNPGDTEVDIEVNKALENHAISPLIYGNNFDLKNLQEQRWGVLRAGGNRSTAYNWENNASNAGSDYLFQNDDLASKSDAPAQALLDFIDGAAAIAAPVVLTVSNADYVAADKNGGGDVRQSGPHYLSTRFKRNHARKGSPLTAAPDPNDGDVYQDEFVAFIKAQRPHAKVLFSMDNEPELWSITHAEVFSSPVTYADLWRRNHDYARAVKDVWPSAEVLGFVSFGYSGFTNLQNASDADGRNFLDWYLDQARAAEHREHVRLIDYLDLHWYPEAQGDGERVTGTNTTPAVVNAREQAPRSLWDPSYRESSWIQKSIWGSIDLLHWLQAKVDRHYPGTKLAFSEWNYGGGNHISGAIAVADVLGIFGRYGVGLATYWCLNQDESFAYAAFRAFRNYDGEGASFGDISISATTSRPDKAPVYASMQSDHPERTTIMLINKEGVKRSVGLRIHHDVAYSKADVFVLTGDKPALTMGSALRSVAGNAFHYDMPAQSISVIVPQR